MDFRTKHIKAALKQFTSKEGDSEGKREVIAKITALLEQAYLILLEAAEDQAHYNVLEAQVFAEIKSERRAEEYARQNPHDKDWRQNPHNKDLSF
jgi:hypothetical protein